MEHFFFCFIVFVIVEWRLFASRLWFPRLFFPFAALWRFSVVSSQNPAFDSASLPENKTPPPACRMRRARGAAAAPTLSVSVAPQRVWTGWGQDADRTAPRPVKSCACVFTSQHETPHQGRGRASSVRTLLRSGCHRRASR